MKIIKKNKIFFSLILIPYLYLLVICSYRTNQTALLTGDITPIESLIEIDSTYEEKGSFNSIYVISFDHSTIFQNRLVNTSKINVTNTVSSAYQYMSNSEVSQMSKLQHKNSVQSAIITAYSAAKEFNPIVNLEYQLAGAYVSWYNESASNLKIGDKIVAVNGQHISTDTEAFRLAFNARKLNDIITVIRDKEEKDILLDADHYGRFNFLADYEINYQASTPQIKVNSSISGGPSGGLLQTLEVFNRLVEEDFSLGKRIAGTGTMNLDGTVGAIGGIQQKIHTAYKRKVNIFFCPTANYNDALSAYNTLRHKERMALVEVKTFSDAIDYLNDAM